MSKAKLVEYKFSKSKVNYLARHYSTKGFLARPSNDEMLVIPEARFIAAVSKLKVKLSNFLRVRKPRALTDKWILERSVFCHIETGGRYVVDFVRDTYSIPIKVTDTSVLISSRFEEAVRKKHKEFGCMIDVVIFDDVFDSGKTFLKVANALENVFYKEGVEFRIVIASVFRRRTPDHTREDYGFSTLNTELLPNYKLVYGERVNSTKYLLLPWEKPKPKTKSKRKK